MTPISNKFFYKVPCDMVELIYKLTSQVEEENIAGLFLTAGEIAQATKLTTLEQIQPTQNAIKVE